MRLAWFVRFSMLALLSAACGGAPAPRGASPPSPPPAPADGGRSRPEGVRPLTVSEHTLSTRTGTGGVPFGLELGVGAQVTAVPVGGNLPAVTFSVTAVERSAGDEHSPPAWEAVLRAAAGSEAAWPAPARSVIVYPAVAAAASIPRSRLDPATLAAADVPVDHVRAAVDTDGDGQADWLIEGDCAVDEDGIQTGGPPECFGHHVYRRDGRSWTRVHSF